MDGWQKVDNNDISDFWFFFSVNDKTKQCKLLKLLYGFYKAKADDRTYFKTFQVIFIYCSRDLIRTKRYYINCPQNIIHARYSKFSNPRNYIHAKNQKILVREIKTAQKLIYLRWWSVILFLQFEMKTYIVWTPSLVKWGFSNFP